MMRETAASEENRAEKEDLHKKKGEDHFGLPLGVSGVHARKRSTKSGSKGSLRLPSAGKAREREGI